VAVTHRSAALFVRWAAAVFAPDELAAVLAATSIAFDLSVFEIFVRSRPAAPWCWRTTPSPSPICRPGAR